MKKIAKKEGRFPAYLLAFPLALASFACLLLPFVHYKYKAKVYQANGSAFITGRNICGGTYHLTPHALVWIALVAVLLCVVTAIFISRKNRLLGSKILCALSALGLVCLVIFSASTGTMIHAAKSVGSSYGVYVCILTLILQFALALYEMREVGLVNSLFFMMLPGLLYLLINNYIPMFGLFIAFKKIDYTKGLWKSDWVGFDNFKYLFQTKDAWIITRNTLLYNFAFIILGLLTGLIVGLALNEIFSRRLQKLYQTTILLPQLISIIIVTYIVFAFLGNDVGLLNKILGDKALNFYAAPKYWPFILAFVHLWKGLGYNAVIFLSSICGIDKNLYDAAKVDGATKWQQLLHVTLPQLKPTIVTLFLLQCGRIFYSDFGLFYEVPLHAGALANVTETIDTYVYKALMVSNNISTSSAAGAFQAVVGFLLVLTVNYIVKKVDEDNALF